MVDFSKIFADIAENNKDEFFDYIIDKDIGVAGRVAINHLPQDRLRAFVKRIATERDKKTAIKYVLDYRKIILDEYIRDKMIEIMFKGKVVEKEVGKVVEKVVEKEVGKDVGKVVEKEVGKVVGKRVEKVVEKEVEKRVEKEVEKVVGKKRVAKRKVDKILRSDDVMPLKKRVRKSQSSESEEEEPKIHSRLGRWSNKDEKILADYLNSHTDVDFEHLEKTLDRSYDSISRKMNKMVRNGKVDSNEGKRWSEKDEKILTDHINLDADVDFEYLEKILGRSRRSINRKIRKMIDVNSTPSNEGKRWSDEDVKVLTDHLNLYTDVNFIYLKRVLGRSRGSIHRKMDRIKDNDNLDV